MPVAAEELDVVDPGGLDPPQDLRRVRALGGRPGHDHVARSPEPGAGRGEQCGHKLFNSGRPGPFPPRVRGRGREYVDRNMLNAHPGGPHVSLQAAPRPAAAHHRRVHPQRRPGQVEGRRADRGADPRLRQRHLPVRQAIEPTKFLRLLAAARSPSGRRCCCRWCPPRSPAPRWSGSPPACSASTSGRRECAAADGPAVDPAGPDDLEGLWMLGTGLASLIDGLTARTEPGDRSVRRRRPPRATSSRSNTRIQPGVVAAHVRGRSASTRRSRSTTVTSGSVNRTRQSPPRPPSRRPAAVRRPRTRPSRSGRGAVRPAPPATAPRARGPRARAAGPRRSRRRSSGPSAGGTSPSTTPCGSSTIAAAKRHPPTWLASHVRSGCSAASAAASGRPRTAQHVSCRPCVHTRKSGPSSVVARCRVRDDVDELGARAVNSPVRTDSCPGRESTRNQRRCAGRTGRPGRRTSSTRPVRVARPAVERDRRGPVEPRVRPARSGPTGPGARRGTSARRAEPCPPSGRPPPRRRRRTAPAAAGNRRRHGRPAGTTTPSRSSRRTSTTWSASSIPGRLPTATGSPPSSARTPPR